MTSPGRLTTAEGREFAARWLAGLEAALEARAEAALGEMFLPHGYWRDVLALTWELRSFAGPDCIAQGLCEALKARTPMRFRLEERAPEMYERKGRGWTIEVFFTFETDIAQCRGHLRLLTDKDDNGRWKAWTFFTAMEDLKGFEERAGQNRPDAVVSHGPSLGDGGSDERASSVDGSPAHGNADEPQVLVIGAGQAGLTIAARLAQLGVDTLVVERNARVGDNWRHRYQSLVLHNQVWANHLPYLPFPASWPVYFGKDQLADWLEAYAAILSINVWTGTTLAAQGYNEQLSRWTVQLQRADGRTHTVRPRHIVMATGVFGIPRGLDIKGAEGFDGTILNASEYAGDAPSEDVRALVIGSGSSAHDVAQNLYETGAEVTMLQRSSTCVVSVDPGAARAYSIYAEGGLPVEDADLITNSFPMPLLGELHRDLTNRIADMDRDLLQGLRDAGFALDFGEDGSGFLMKYHRYGGGYYINVGCSDLIVAGKIKVKHGVEVERLEAERAVFSDGSSLDVNMVVVATGYQNMSESVRAVLGNTVADRVGPVWGLDDEGEVRAMWRRTGQPGFWLMGGSLQQCRPYSKYLALQIKGVEEGLLD